MFTSHPPRRIGVDRDLLGRRITSALHTLRWARAGVTRNPSGENLLRLARAEQHLDELLDAWPR